MSNCNECLENNWFFRVIDGWIIATCKHCTFEVEFPTKKEKLLIKQNK